MHATRPTKRWSCSYPVRCRVRSSRPTRRSRRPGIDGVHLFDSRSASLGLGMLGLRASELAESGWSAAEIVKELGSESGEQSGMFLSVDTYDNLIRSGRVSRGKAWLGGLLDVKPILTLTDDGRVAPADRVRGRDQVVPKVLSLLERKLTPAPDCHPLRHRTRRCAGRGRTAAERARGGVQSEGRVRLAGHRGDRHTRGLRRLGACSTRWRTGHPLACPPREPRSPTRAGVIMACPAPWRRRCRPPRIARRAA